MASALGSSGSCCFFLFFGFLFVFFLFLLLVMMAASQRPIDTVCVELETAISKGGRIECTVVCFVLDLLNLIEAEVVTREW